MAKKHALFTVTGVELEYMIVDRYTLQVKPIADELIKEVTGDYTSDVERSDIAWSNELVCHVIELKTNGPAATLQGISEAFHNNVLEINDMLDKHNAMLLPTGAHPLMNPFRETVIWPHEYNEVYSLYNRIFDCRGHGWANLQSMHLNLPFANDEEFGRLHAAIRALLPILPALTASTPILDGQITGFDDTRLEKYRHNQEKIPSIAGQIIPEAVYTEADYHRVIFDPIIRDIKPYDQDNLLSHFFLNSRGAIARFDRGAIEIRTIDLQECPAADLAIAEIVTTLLKQLTDGEWLSMDHLMALDTTTLAELWLDATKSGMGATLQAGTLAELWRVPDGSTLQTVWERIAVRLAGKLSPHSTRHLERILEYGNLSQRILQRVNSSGGDTEAITECYFDLAGCLANNEPFLP